MTDKEIELLFIQAINKKAIYYKLEGITEDRIYNWRKGRVIATFGDMLNVLYQLNLIKITKTDETH